MGQPIAPSPVLLILAGFSRHEEAIEWARNRAEAIWGAILLESPAFDFSETDYYRATMGDGLKKQFFAFERLIDPADLVDFKLQANAWEAEYRSLRAGPEQRPLNLDPGYITLAKLVLASTKDFAHRLYLGRGIYAEITLHFRSGAWQPTEWTYPDYRRSDFQRFFVKCRDALKRSQSQQKRVQ